MASERQRVQEAGREVEARAAALRSREDALAAQQAGLLQREQVRWAGLGRGGGAGGTVGAVEADCAPSTPTSPPPFHPTHPTPPHPLTRLSQLLHERVGEAERAASARGRELEAAAAALAGREASLRAAEKRVKAQAAALARLEAEDKARRDAVRPPAGRESGAPCTRSLAWARMRVVGVCVRGRGSGRGFSVYVA